MERKCGADDFRRTLDQTAAFYLPFRQWTTFAVPRRRARTTCDLRSHRSARVRSHARASMRSKIARCAGSPPGHGKRGPLAKWQVERRRLVKSAPEIIGTALAFHYVNRTVDVFLEKSPMELPSTLAWAKAP